MQLVLCGTKRLQTTISVEGLLRRDRRLKARNEGIFQTVPLKKLQIWFDVLDYERGGTLLGWSSVSRNTLR